MCLIYILYFQSAIAAQTEGYDVFDPSLLPNITSEGHFGHHIFGHQKWQKITGLFRPPVSDLLSEFLQSQSRFKTYFGVVGECKI